MPGPERRLVAILSADVVGYSRLMADDEDATVHTLRAHREEIELLLRQRGGRLVDFTGDNFLAEFASAVEAVTCAVQIQRALEARNAELASHRRVQFRMGAHLGDVRVEGDQLFGDGVNVAARLEGLAEPGGVCISRSVRDQVRSTPGLVLQELGAQLLKNIPEPVEVYAVRWSESAPGGRVTAGKGPASVAVLPFANMSADPEQEYFADGMAEELINALARVEGLRVIARTSAFAFKGTNADIATIGSRLGVGTVVEGSVRRSGSRLRIAAQLIDVAGGHHLWSEIYDRPLDDVFEVQDEIARTIVTTIKPKLLAEDAPPLVSRRTTNQDAYDLYLRAGDRIARMNESDTRSAVAMLEEATALDPRFAGAWARLGLSCSQMDSMFDSDLRWHQKAEQALARVFSLDPENAEAHAARGRVLWSPRNGFRNREALVALREALRLQPGSREARVWYSSLLFHVGLLAESEESAREVLAAEPADATIPQLLGQNLMFQGRYEEAAEYHARALSIDASHFFTQVFQPVVHLYLEELAAAERTLGVARRLVRDDPLLDGIEALLWAKRGEVGRAEAALAGVKRERASVSHNHHAWHYAAAACALLGRTEEAVGRLRDAACAGLPNFPVFRDDPHFAGIRDEPEMLGLLAELEDEWHGYRRDFGTTPSE